VEAAKISVYNLFSSCQYFWSPITKLDKVYNLFVSYPLSLSALLSIKIHVVLFFYVVFVFVIDKVKFMTSHMEKDKETVAIEEEGFSLELPAPSGWKKKVPFLNSPSLYFLGCKV